MKMNNREGVSFKETEKKKVKRSKEMQRSELRRSLKYTVFLFFKKKCRRQITCIFVRNKREQRLCLNYVLTLRGLYFDSYFR